MSHGDEILVAGEEPRTRFLLSPSACKKKRNERGENILESGYMRSLREFLPREHLVGEGVEAVAAVEGLQEVAEDQEERGGGVRGRDLALHAVLNKKPFFSVFFGGETSEFLGEFVPEIQILLGGGSAS